MKISNVFPCLLSSRVGAASSFLIWGEGRGVSRGQVSGVARWLVHTSGGVECRGACAVDWLILSHMLLFLKSGCSE